jgi:methionyl aminopeptidase
MIEAGKIVGELLEVLRKSTFPGITTKELDRIAENYIIKNGAIPSFKGQKGFGRNVPDYPASICASVNDEIIHGIPGGRTLKEGDIVSIDVGAEYKGYHGDAARTFPVGNISKDAQRLIDVTRESFFTGIRKAVPGNRIFEISGAIQDYVESNGYTVVREFVGHGIGRELHEEPEVPNYRGRIKGPRLVAGMAIAVEPMVNEGTASIYLGKNNWTVYTADGKLSAHYENTIIITDGDPLLTTLIS